MRISECGFRIMKCEFLIVDRGERVGAGSKPALNKMRDERQKTTGKAAGWAVGAVSNPPFDRQGGSRPLHQIRNPQSAI